MPFLPHGKGYILSKQENIGIAAIWSNQGTPTGMIVSITQDGQRKHTPMRDGIKHGIEFGELINGDTFKVYYKTGVILDMELENPDEFGYNDIGELP